MTFTPQAPGSGTLPTQQAHAQQTPTQHAPSSMLGRILELLNTTRTAQAPVTVAELAELTGIPRSSTARIVTELIDQRYLQRTGDGILLGFRLFELGSRTSIPKQMTAAAAPLIKNLWDLTGDRVSLWVRHGESMVLLAATAGRIKSLPTQPGMRTSALTTASGKASLAFTDHQVVDQVCERVPPHFASDFKTELKVVHSTAVANDIGVAFPGLRGLASPVLAAGNRAIGAIAVTGLEGVIDAEETTPLLLEAVNSLTHRLQAA